jgi:hypothetical protein
MLLGQRGMTCVVRLHRSVEGLTVLSGKFFGSSQTKSAISATPPIVGSRREGGQLG